MDYTTEPWQFCDILLFEKYVQFFFFFVTEDNFLMIFVWNFNLKWLHYKFINRDGCKPWKEKKRAEINLAFMLWGKLLLYIL